MQNNEILLGSQSRMIKQQAVQSQKSRTTTLFGNRPSMKKGNKNCTPAIGLNGVAHNI
ncbi:hypothetical protein C1H46_032290 [Malus baccata]|uniref:Uncharacterized protein n=1 Tax=Malus baccata TaxID=106549 RepID=A0A540L6N6_MALBA|nr:hypothetical protein C1H46_032290 [Malus baccata]